MDLQDWFFIGMKRETNTLIQPRNPQYNLGSGRQVMAGVTALDLPDWDARFSAIPAEDGGAGTIWANHLLEHLTPEEAIGLLRDMERSLQIGGTANIVTPYYNSQMQAHDLTHKSVWCEASWSNLFNPPYYDRGQDRWRFKVNVCFIIGIVERNLALFTQLERIE